MKIRYDAEMTALGVRVCNTPCPFDRNRNALMKIRVASTACHGCKHFLRDDTNKNILTCTHPKTT